eukprot:scaffold111_cov404-Prasinococcus_capsulatus_cf.AAC.5
MRVRRGAISACKNLPEEESPGARDAISALIAHVSAPGPGANRPCDGASRRQLRGRTFGA